MVDGTRASRLPTARPRLASFTLSPLLHFASNLAAVVWLAFVTSQQAAISELIARSETMLGYSQPTPQSEVLAGIAWLPVGLTILLDLIAGTQINAAILEYNGMSKAAVAKARGGVQGDISNIPEHEKEEIFGVLEGWELKSLRDTFALLTRQVFLLTASIAPSAAVIFYFATITSALPLPGHMASELVVLVGLKLLILLYWLYENLRIREVRLNLFHIE